ncbi:MAG: rane transporter [Bacteroidota bacterium]
MSFLSREHTIAPEGFNRWKVPVAALCIHLCIGQIYAFSVFNKPMSQLIGVTTSSADDWTLTQLGWIFSIALFFLGASAATFGKWMERVGPRRAMFAAAVCFSSGFFLSAIGIYLHQIWLLYLGSGVVGGIGLGLGYISPVSTLIKWFPDRPGMATGMAIMGFGGGGMIASPLSVYLMELFSNASSNGVGATFVVMGVIYLMVMLLGSFLVRVPAENWKPEGFDPSKIQQKKMVTTQHVLVDSAVKTPQFYLLFGVLMLNVTAGIGVLGQASVMIQELFSEASVGTANAIDAKIAAGFVMLLSLFNMVGRFFWSSLSDYIGRRNTYIIFFTLGVVLYASIPSIGASGSVVIFVAAFAIIMSMYGGGFATIPAYLRDLFGTKQVGAIHGRLLLAWSAAAIFGPVIINYLRQYQLEVKGMPAAEVYSLTMYIMAGLLLIGLFCNLMVTPVHERFYEKKDR